MERSKCKKQKKVFSQKAAKTKQPTKAELKAKAKQQASLSFDKDLADLQEAWKLYTFNRNGQRLAMGRLLFRMRELKIYKGKGFVDFINTEVGIPQASVYRMITSYKKI